MEEGLAIARRGWISPRRLHGKSQPSYTRAVARPGYNYIYFPTKPGLIFAYKFSFYNLHINKQNL